MLFIDEHIIKIFILIQRNLPRHSDCSDEMLQISEIAVNHYVEDLNVRELNEIIFEYGFENIYDLVYSDFQYYDDPIQVMRLMVSKILHELYCAKFNIF